LKKLNREKKPIKILKKSTGSIRFWFYKLEIKKTKLNRTQTEKNWKKTEPNRKKSSQTGLNRFLSQKTNRTEPKPVNLNRFRFFLKKFRSGYFFFDKNRTKPKMITPTIYYLVLFDNWESLP